jgi:hypothetical protein
MPSKRNAWIIASCAVIGCASLAACDGEGAENTAATDTGHIAFDSTIVDLGRVASGEPKQALFTFRNVGTGPLDVAEECDSPVTVYGSLVVPPRGQGMIGFAFDPKGRDGDVKDTVDVHSSDPANPVSTLTVRANVDLLLGFLVPSLEVEASPGATVERRVRLTGKLAREASLEIRDAPAGVLADVARIIDDDLPYARLWLTVDPSVTIGDSITGSLQIAATGAGIASLQLRIHVVDNR